jgi:D-inositol-3-phosphate glycosyltransferase
MALLICLCCKNAPIVFAHVGGAPQTYSAFTTFWRLPFSLIERKAMSYADKTLAQSQWIHDRLAKLFSNVTLCCPWGVDFDLFKPIDKQRARKELGLPLDKRILLYVGRLDSIKGVGTILDIYGRMKPDVELVLVGGQKNDPLYQQAIESGAIIRGQVLQSELVPYYSAADVYLLPKFYAKNEMADVEEFMSIGLAQIEAMACGCSSVGTNLYHLLGSKDERKQMGKIPNSSKDAIQCILEIVEHPEQYKNCRRIAEKYYGWDGIVKQMVSIYDELHEKYYG